MNINTPVDINGLLRLISILRHNLFFLRLRVSPKKYSLKDYKRREFRFGLIKDRRYNWEKAVHHPSITLKEKNRKKL